MTREPRADKELNRLRLTAAAGRALQRDGLGVSMRAIAREAGMGIATAYRHFPTKNDLIEAVLAEQVATCTQAMQAALREPDPWTGLTTVIAWFAEVQIEHPGLLRVLLDNSTEDSSAVAGPAGNAPFADARRAHGEALHRLVAGARTAGDLRPDVTTDDVRVGMMAMTAFSSRPDALTGAAVRALHRILIRGISAGSRPD
ncbi:TetR/AcrR family transcriptional regulator [Cryobacterium sp. SO2]|uniref:TetR/AcrR family transcriptional regulator n=1 Tax=Cryobacterium sp. SO2 TaxID=1897060 RepID=UPI00223DAD13|nr:TetR/AcrR family transcriptional regulator [Cryobacterium sp. SO2]WEO79307.1 TetR/AcrR family transcriptional regulator [Cryobacterium sp. SO2]